MVIRFQACVTFSGRLRLECTGEDIGKATNQQIARSYSAGNPTVGIEHSPAWWRKHAPKAYAALTPKGLYGHR